MCPPRCVADGCTGWSRAWWWRWSTRRVRRTAGCGSRCSAAFATTNALRRRPAMAEKKQTVTVDVDGHHLALSNLAKVLYPDVGFSKGEIIDYYSRIAPVLLPHLAD